MNRLIKSKLNFLLTQWPANTVLTSYWLNEHGYYKQLVKLYCDNGWIKSLGKGAFMRLNDEVSWEGAIRALQSQLKLPIHVGGLTALQFYGISQYVSLNERNPVFYLYSSTLKKITLPVWFEQYFTHCHVEQKKLYSSTIGISNKEMNGVQLSVSIPERAILEVLALVPNRITLSHANDLMEGLERLRGEIIQQLLKDCYSIKVKRLFLCLAEKNNLPCFNELNVEQLDLGSGKRVIGEGGIYYPKWLLSLPRLDEFDDQRGSERE